MEDLLVEGDIPAEDQNTAAKEKAVRTVTWRKVVEESGVAQVVSNMLTEQ